MSTEGFLLLLGTILGGVLAVLTIIVVVWIIVSKLGDALNGLDAVRKSLLSRGLDPRIVERIGHELEMANGGMGCGMLVGLGGLAGLGYGLYELSGMYAPEPEELAMYPAPGLLFVVIAAVMMVRARRINPDSSATHRALVTRAREVTFLVPTMQLLNLDVTSAADALTGTRASRWTPVPHVVVVYADGSDFAVRAFLDDDVQAAQLAEALRRALPHANVAPFTREWKTSAARAANAVAAPI